MSHHTAPYLGEGLRVVSDECLAEGAGYDALPERVHHHPFVLEVQPHYLCSKAVEELLRCLSLILSYVKEIIRDGRGSLIRDVLCSEQLCELRKRRYMAIREADEPVHCCSRQGAHEQLASYRIRAPHQHHLRVESRKMSLRVSCTSEGHLGSYERCWYCSFHDFLREQRRELPRRCHKLLIHTLTLTRTGLQISAQFLVRTT